MRFFLELLANRSEIGAVAPSSRWLGERLSGVVSHIKNREQGLRVLEIGPGTGAITRILHHKLNPIDQLVLVELNPFFCSTLQSKIEHWSQLEGAPDMKLYQGSILDYPEKFESLEDGKKFDLIISSLPLNSFSAEVSQRIFNHICSLVKEGGIISYYEYLGVRWLKRLLAKPYRSKTFSAHDFIHLHRPDIRQQESKVFRNLPPAVVRTLYV